MNKLPKITLAFWIMKIAATTIGTFLAVAIPDVSWFGVVLALVHAAPFAVVTLMALATLYGAAALPIYGIAVAHANDKLAGEQYVPASSTLLLCYGLGAVCGPVTASQTMLLFGPSGLFVFLASVGALAVVVGGDGAGRQDGRHRSLDGIRLVLQLQAVTQQEGRRQNRADRIGQILTGDVRRWSWAITGNYDRMVSRSTSEIGVPLGDRKRVLQALARRPQARAAAEGERRQLTILFADLVDATTLCQSLSPEAWRNVVLAYQQAAVDILQRHGGADVLAPGLVQRLGRLERQRFAGGFLRERAGRSGQGHSQQGCQGQGAESENR